MSFSGVLLDYTCRTFANLMVPILNLTFTEGTVRYIFSEKLSKQKKSKCCHNSDFVCMRIELCSSCSERMCWITSWFQCMFFFTLLQQQKNLEGYVGFASLPNQVYRKSVKRGFEFTLMVVGKNTCCCVCPCFLWIMSLYLLRLAFRSPSVCVHVWICSAIFIHKAHVPQLCSVNWRVREEGNILLLVCEWILIFQKSSVWDVFIWSCTQRIKRQTVS